MRVSRPAARVPICCAASVGLLRPHCAVFACVSAAHSRAAVSPPLFRRRGSPAMRWDGTRMCIRSIVLCFRLLLLLCLVAPSSLARSWSSSVGSLLFSLVGVVGRRHLFGRVSPPSSSAATDRETDEKIRMGGGWFSEGSDHRRQGQKRGRCDATSSRPHPR